MNRPTWLLLFIMQVWHTQSCLPTELDYRNWNGRNVVSPVQDQGPVKSCWAFVTIGALESQMLMANKTEANLSPQQIMDCVDPTREEGDSVKGWDQRASIQYLRAKGAVSGNDYPYTSDKTKVIGCCKDDKYDVVQRVEGLCAQEVPIHPIKLKSVLFHNGPQAATVVANKPWKEDHIKGGVIECSAQESSNPQLTGVEGNHAILLIGYTKKEGKDVWIVKNSYGKQWGEDGFGYLTMELGKDCGITQHIIASPIIPEGALEKPRCMRPPPRFYCSPWNYREGMKIGETDSTDDELRCDYK